MLPGQTDRHAEVFIVQGWKVTDPDALAQLHMPDHEAAVAVPKELMQSVPERIVEPLTDEQLDDQHPQWLRRATSTAPATTSLRSAWRHGARPGNR
jgi:hypothetical protein